jgi:phage I-like protein
MTTDADRVAAKVATMFPNDAAVRVTKLLAAYETDEPMSADRVRLAVLKLSAGDADRIPELLRLARIDPRDVVGEAEYTRQMHHPPGMASAREIEADRSDYEAWLAQ